LGAEQHFGSLFSGFRGAVAEDFSDALAVGPEKGTSLIFRKNKNNRGANE